MSDEFINILEGVEQDAQEKANETIAGQEQPAKETGESNEPKTPQWYWKEELPGEGEKPEFLLGKYKSVYDQAKAYRELESKFGAFKGAPEEYKFDEIPEKYGIKLDSENEVFKGFVELCKTSNVSQDFLDNVIELYSRDLKAKAPMTKEAIYKELGDDAPNMIKRLGTWGSNFLTSDEMHTLNALMVEPSIIRLFDKVRAQASKSALPNVPTGNQSTGFAKRTSKQIQQEIIDNAEKYRNNTTYRESLLKELHDIVG